MILPKRSVWLQLNRIIIDITTSVELICGINLLHIDRLLAFGN